MKPFLKYPGGKLRLVPKILRALPRGKRPVEPFVGSGAVFMNTDFPAYLLADSNADVINLFQVLLKHGERFIQHARWPQGFNTPGRYYQNRDEFNRREGSPERQAMLFLFLNRHGYNGLVRYNSQREFNVPFGQHKRPRYPEEEMRAFIGWAEGREITFIHADYRDTMQCVMPGDVVYCDPPYTPISKTADFTAYDGRPFTMHDHQTLAWMANEKANNWNQVTTLISNHSTRATRDLYRLHGAHVPPGFRVRRHIGCKQRNKTMELLVKFAPKVMARAAA